MTNEGKAIDAVIRLIEQRDNLARGHERNPEQEMHRAPIDWAASLDGQLYAFEHTIVEAYSGQIRQNIDARNLIEPLTNALEGKVPKSECWQLQIPIEATTRLSNRDIQRTVALLAEFTITNVPKTPLLHHALAGEIPLVKVNGVPFEVRLRRFSGNPGLHGKFYVIRLVQSNLEEARISRLRETCAKKFGKLAAWKRDASARTILILEDSDMFLTNEEKTVEAFDVAENGLEDRPDEVYIVNASTEDDFVVSCARRLGKTYYDSGERSISFPSQSLNDLTGR